MSDGSGGASRRLLLLLGPVAAGKGTQAEALSHRLNLAHLASGDLFRQQVQSGSELGRKANEYMDRGELVPDDLTIAMFMDRLDEPDAERGAILDGFPRTVGQARALDATLSERGEALDRVILIDVPDEEIVRRVAGRRVCPVDHRTYHVTDDPPSKPGRCDLDGTELVHRDDDRPEVVRARLEKQMPPMREVVEHYRRSGIVERFDGTQPIPAITAEILARLDAQPAAGGGSDG